MKTKKYTQHREPQPDSPRSMLAADVDAQERARKHADEVVNKVLLRALIKNINDNAHVPPPAPQ